jgi:polyhydroxyalkanoate synthesis regulator phasin
MTPDTLSETLQKGFHVTLGATTALLEAIQNPQTSSQRFSELGNDVNRITEELEAKGEITEREARQLVDSLLSQVPNPFQGAGHSASVPTVDTVASPVVDSAVQNDLVALTQQLTQMRQEIDALKGETP